MLIIKSFVSSVYLYWKYGSFRIKSKGDVNNFLNCIIKSVQHPPLKTEYKICGNPYKTMIIV